MNSKLESQSKPMTETTEGLNPEEARRTKLEQIAQLGHDPWGHRFDDRQWIGDLRERSGEVVFETEDGNTVALPNESELEELNFKEWLKGQGKGRLKGPSVRAAGRIMLQRDTGKLQFVKYRRLDRWHSAICRKKSNW